MTIEPGLLTIILAAVAGMVIVLALAFAWLIRKHVKLKNEEYEDLAEFVHTLNNEFRDLYHATRAVDERIIATDLRINALDGQVAYLAEKINDVQQNESSNHPYSQAIQKVRRGATVSELMQTSGLSQDEAALLIRLHGSKTP
jgi:septal ring factor EnvC (AmiA/AmiB activator)